MFRHLKKKIAVTVIIEAICLVFLWIFLSTILTNMAVSEQRTNTEEKIRQLDELIANSETAGTQITSAYDDIYQSKAETLAYMVQKQETPDYSTEKMEQYRHLLTTNNVLILDHSGNQLAKSKESLADFTLTRYNQLRTVFAENEASDAFEVTHGDQIYRYYGAKIDDERMAVIEQDPIELDSLVNATSTWPSILDDVTVGLNGYAFAISTRDYTFLYHPKPSYIGTDALSTGLTASDLEERNYDWMTVNGERLYCGVTKVEGEHFTEDAYVVCAVPESEITSSRNITVAMIVFIFFMIMTLIITYSYFTMKDEESNPDRKTHIATIGNYLFNKAVGRKIATISVIGLVLILVGSFYMQTLLSLTRHSINNDQRVKEIEATLDGYEEDIDITTEQYDERFLDKCFAAAYIVSEHPDLANRRDLEDLGDVLDVGELNVYNESGGLIASNTALTNYSLSQDPEDPSYEFNKILQGMDYVIQEARPDEISGEYNQYIGSPTTDAEGNITGLVQISIAPSMLEEALEDVQIGSILDSVKVGKGGFVFAVNKEDGTFTYYPEQKLIGREATAYGMTENELKDGYSDYITLQGETYYGSSMEIGDNYIYAVVPQSAMTGERLPLALASAGFALLCMLIAFVLLTFTRRSEEEDVVNVANESEHGNNIDVKMPDGTVKKSDSAESRWSNISIGWSDKTPEQKFSAVLRWLVALFAFIICLALIFRERAFGENSIFLYIISGRWEHGINIFSITSCILIICVASVLTLLIQSILRLLSKTFGARGETICRLLRSFIKYISVIVVMYYCFALFGVDTRTLLASAGILSLVIGLGAKSLIADILAGLFMIFEGEFRVGDIVTVDGWRGTVVEIGIRTTKIEDPGQDIKVINNSAISGVINMTRQHSYAWADVGIEYGESLERVENILEKEFPNIKKRLPAIVEGPFYKGVIALGDNSVTIRVMVVCAEGDRVQMGRDLNREMKLIFDKYDINIPFPQLVLHEPIEYQKATEWEKWKADRFNQEQKDLSKNAAPGDDNDDR